MSTNKVELKPIQHDHLADTFFHMQDTILRERLADYAAGFLTEDDEAEIRETIENHPVAAFLWAEMETRRIQDETPEGKAHLNAFAEEILSSLEKQLKTHSPLANQTSRSESGSPSQSPKQFKVLTAWSTSFTEGFKSQAGKAAATTGAPGVSILWESSDEDGQRRILRHPNQRLFLEIRTRNKEIAATGVTVRLVDSAPLIEFKGCEPGLFSGKAPIPAEFAKKVMSGEKTIELELASTLGN